MNVFDLLLNNQAKLLKTKTKRVVFAKNPLLYKKNSSFDDLLQRFLGQNGSVEFPQKSERSVLFSPMERGGATLFDRMKHSFSKNDEELKNFDIRMPKKRGDIKYFQTPKTSRASVRYKSVEPKEKEHYHKQTISAPVELNQNVSHNEKVGKTTDVFMESMLEKVEKTIKEKNSADFSLDIEKGVFQKESEKRKPFIEKRGQKTPFDFFDSSKRSLFAPDNTELQTKEVTIERSKGVSKNFYVSGLVRKSTKQREVPSYEIKGREVYIKDRTPRREDSSFNGQNGVRFDAQVAISKKVKSGELQRKNEIDGGENRQILPMDLSLYSENRKLSEHADRKERVTIKSREEVPSYVAQITNSTSKEELKRVQNDAKSFITANPKESEIEGKSEKTFEALETEKRGVTTPNNNRVFQEALRQLNETSHIQKQQSIDTTKEPIQEAFVWDGYETFNSRSDRSRQKNSFGRHSSLSSSSLHGMKIENLAKKSESQSTFFEKEIERSVQKEPQELVAKEIERSHNTLLEPQQSKTFGNRREFMDYSLNQLSDANEKSEPMKMHEAPTSYKTTPWREDLVQKSIRHLQFHWQQVKVQVALGVQRLHVQFLSDQLHFSEGMEQFIDEVMQEHGFDEYRVKIRDRYNALEFSSKSKKKSQPATSYSAIDVKA